MEADAILNEGAVVVEAEHAEIADAAMVRSLGPQSHAWSAERRLSWLPLPPGLGHRQRIAHLLHKLAPLLGRLARALEVRLEVAPHRQDPRDVEHHRQRLYPMLLADLRQDNHQEHSVVDKAREDQAEYARCRYDLLEEPLAPSSLVALVLSAAPAARTPGAAHWAHGAPGAAAPVPRIVVAHHLPGTPLWIQLNQRPDIFAGAGRAAQHLIHL
mmetsp:Transcript_86997/g.221541  ORF Transcript_86997/g.221541 Transcript_86997/m.221541 type:complete len:214 (+) Transcript_86997:679-1320(+)